VTSRLPLSTLLSQALVAFTIEFDNEFEHRMPHRTTNYGSTGGSRQGPWLVSLVMWYNCMQYVGEEGVTVAELQRLARTGTNLDGMRRWGYIVIDPDPRGNRAKRPRPDALIRPTLRGRKAQDVWRPLSGLIEERWQARFGTDEIARLRETLWSLTSQMDIELPDCLPILGYGLFSRGRHSGDERSFRTRAENRRREIGERESDNTSRLPLSALLSQVLLAFVIEFERESEVSLAISANVLRVLDEQGVQLRNLPLLSGVSKEAISMAIGILQENGLAVVEPDPAGSRFNVIRLTSKGQEAQDRYRQLLDAIEERGQARFGTDAIRNLREALECLVGEPTAQTSPLFRGLEPYPDGWRASVRKPATLPHYPMVLHRGGFPDGS
jgi:DNA-binding MarR family transcriptional regulator